MSFWASKCFQKRFCHHAFILARTRLYVPHSRLPAIAIFERSAHNSLYQMVKKRTLEARTKLQASKFPNNQPCMSKKNFQNEEECDEYEAAAATTIPYTAQDKIDCDAENSTVLCQEVLKAPNAICHTSRSNPGSRSSPASRSSTTSSSSSSSSSSATSRGMPEIDDCKPPAFPNRCEDKPSRKAGGGSSGRGGGGKGGGAKGGGGGGGGGKGPCKGGGGKEIVGSCMDSGKPPPPCPEDNSTKIKCLLGILAALGAGALIAYLLTRGRTDPSIVIIDPNAEDKAMLGQRIPATSADLPKHVPYLLIGGGTAAFSAFRAIKSNDAKAKVLIISNEYRRPYMRPPLSKELWYSPHPEELSKDYRFKQWTGSERSLFFEPQEFFLNPTKLDESSNGGIAVAQGFEVRKIDPENRVATLTDGYEISYDECLIATGCTPKNLNLFKDSPPSVREKIMVYRTPEDFDRLRRYAAEKRAITIIGNGFIGSELACSLANFAKEKGGKVFQVFQESGNMSKVLPNYLSKWTMLKMENLGVCVVPNASIRSVQRDETQLKLELSNGTTVLTDIVVVCVGCEPNTKLANLSGLEVDRHLGGFVVNAELEARRNLYVAGDASCFYDPLLGRRRVEHHDHSVVSGRLAGENMVGKKKAYQHQSMFWSDLGPEIGYEGIGLVDASLPTVGVFALPSKADRKVDNLTEVRSDDDEHSMPDQKLPDVKCDPVDGANYGKGVIFYLKDDKIVGILLWNLFNRIGLARTIINQNKKYDDLNEVAKLFEIHS